ncbi:hypothetical protein DL991_39970 [Amycolatopsis sp. WAC 01375]|nr:hypothetical protein DL991_39970 [Amycolatopsis sp. WAC 01375]RSN30612.1 hypothetical protein DL990_21785 [Amycolatopsis sp. WAC 01416]
MPHWAHQGIEAAPITAHSRGEPRGIARGLDDRSLAGEARGERADLIEKGEVRDVELGSSSVAMASVLAP